MSTTYCTDFLVLAQLDYLINSLGKRGVFEEADYKRLLKSPLSRMWINWDGQCNLLAYAVCLYSYILYTRTIHTEIK